MRQVPLLLLAAALAVGCARSIELPPDAERAASAALRLLDAQQYEASWDEAARIFRDAVSKEDWLVRAREVRSPHGAFSERARRSAVAKTDPLNSPEGEYILITYDSRFAEGVVIETLVLYLEEGSWRMAGYFLKD